MQKVVGSNPISRFRKGLYLQAFFACAVGLCVCVGSDLLRTRRGPIVGRSKKNGLFAGRFWFVRTEVLLQACRRSSVPAAAAVGRLVLQDGTFFADGRLPVRGQRSRSLGPSPISVRIPEASPFAPHSEPAEPWLPALRPHSRRRRTHRRVSVTGRLGHGNRSGFHRRGCRLRWKRGSARNRAGLPSYCLSS
jgi:hypothetical protein